jgi:aspartate-semialdehyde dehydrogenase
LLAVSPVVKVVDNPQQMQYPTPVMASGQDLIYVGRIRKNESTPNSLVFWCCGDQIRKGAATNAVQIAELLSTK